MEHNDIIIFEFTTQEESDIEQAIMELSELTCVLLSEAVRTDEVSNVNVFDIIYYILENSQKGRGNEMRFAIQGVIEYNGAIKIVHNPDILSSRSNTFLENLLNKQLEFFQESVPAMIEIFKRDNLHKLDDGVEIESLENTSQVV